jgi:hypothetical protein
MPPLDVALLSLLGVAAVAAAAAVAVVSLRRCAGPDEPCPHVPLHDMTPIQGPAVADKERLERIVKGQEQHIAALQRELTARPVWDGTPPDALHAAYRTGYTDAYRTITGYTAQQVYPPIPPATRIGGAGGSGGTFTGRVTRIPHYSWCAANTADDSGRARTCNCAGAAIEWTGNTRG